MRHLAVNADIAGDELLPHRVRGRPVQDDSLLARQPGHRLPVREKDEFLGTGILCDQGRADEIRRAVVVFDGVLELQELRANLTARGSVTASAKKDATISTLRYSHPSSW